jgi:hypothetical protein
MICMWLLMAVLSKRIGCFGLCVYDGDPCVRED